MPNKQLGTIDQIDVERTWNIQYVFIYIPLRLGLRPTRIIYHQCWTEWTRF